MELKLYLAKDGDYDLNPGEKSGMGVCTDGLKEYTTMTEFPDVLYAVFRKRETDNTFEIVPASKNRTGTMLKSRPGESNYPDNIDLYYEFGEECSYAAERGYRFVEFQVDA